MPRDSDDDRPRKSWREIDQSREKGSGSPRPAAADRPNNSQAYRSYKTQLNRLFDGGHMPEAIKSKLGDTAVAPGVKERKAANDLIIAATNPKQLQTAVHAFTAAYGLPEDEAALTKMLDLTDESWVLQSINALATLQREGVLKRGAALRGRLKTVEMTIDEPDVRQAARDLLQKL